MTVFPGRLKASPASRFTGDMKLSQLSDVRSSCRFDAEIAPLVPVSPFWICTSTSGVAVPIPRRPAAVRVARTEVNPPVPVRKLSVFSGGASNCKLSLPSYSRTLRVTPPESCFERLLPVPSSRSPAATCNRLCGAVVPTPTRPSPSTTGSPHPERPWRPSLHRPPASGW